jgi:hypothetical protein
MCREERNRDLHYMSPEIHRNVDSFVDTHAINMWALEPILFMFQVCDNSTEEDTYNASLCALLVQN